MKKLNLIIVAGFLGLSGIYSSTVEAVSYACGSSTGRTDNVTTGVTAYGTSCQDAKNNCTLALYQAVKAILESMYYCDAHLCTAGQTGCVPNSIFMPTYTTTYTQCLQDETGRFSVSCSVSQDINHIAECTPCRDINCTTK
jgi:hypothetical protein